MPARARISAAIFIGSAALLLALHGQRMVLTNDEGIILESAQRIVAGQRIYVDFFGYMSPGSYWLQALVFRLLGIALWSGRLIVILDFALQSALVYWLTSRLSSWRAAAVVTLTFFGFQVADPAFLTAAHRWDSATFALAGLCLAVSAFLDNGKPWKWVASGACLAAAAWCTPSVAMVAVVVGLWLATARERRNHLAPLAAGAAVVGVAGLAGLAVTGSVGAFITQMTWLQRNYAASNVFPYGSIIGGYRALFEGSQGVLEMTVRVILVWCVALPAILPPLAILLQGFAIGSGREKERRDVLILLLGAMAALTASAFPRADVMHLAFIAALPYALTGCALAGLLPRRTASWFGLGTMVLAAVFASNFVRGWRDTVQVRSPVGILRVSREQAPVVEEVLREIRPGDGLFVYPYMPVQYFLTQGRNPTRYPYLQPGLMTAGQEAEALAQLEAHPPEWVLHLQLSREEFLRVFRNGTNLDWRFPKLEAWMEQNYQPVQHPQVNIGGYQLWRRFATPESTTSALR